MGSIPTFLKKSFWDFLLFFSFVFYISWDSVMVTCKAHNLETENACVGSIPTPATKKLQSVVVWELLRLKSYDQNDTHNLFSLSLFSSDLIYASVAQWLVRLPSKQRMTVRFCSLAQIYALMCMVWRLWVCLRINYTQ